MAATQTPVAIGIDIGGTGIKGALVNLYTGALIGERQKIKTPEGAPIDAVLAAVEQLHRKILAQSEAELPTYPIGMCMPALVRHGVTYSAANIATDWLGFDAAAAFSERLGRPVSLVNDADAAGYGEVKFGHGKDSRGVLLVITLGTGIGSALIHNGNLVPNTELGHLSLGEHTDYETYASVKAQERDGVSLEVWTRERLTPYFAKLEQLFSPDRFIISGGLVGVVVGNNQPGVE